MSASSSIRRDVMSAYSAAAARIMSWVVVSGLIFRQLGPDAFAFFALVRATIGLFSYSALGIGPAMISRLAAAANVKSISIEFTSPVPILNYESAVERPRTIYSTGTFLLIVLGIGGVIVAPC